MNTLKLFENIKKHKYLAIFLKFFYDIYKFFYARVFYFVNHLKYNEFYPVDYRIFDKFNLVYIENTKVACSSIKYTIGDVCNLRTSLKLDDQTSNYYKFTFVRNPYDRLVSCYKNKIINKKDTWITIMYYFSAKKYGIYKGMPFDEFIDVVYKIPDKERDVHFRSQYNTLYKSYEGNVKIDFIGRFETLAEDFGKLSKQFSIPNLPHINKSNKPLKAKSWKDFYTPELSKKVYDIYKKDFDTWYPCSLKELDEYLEAKG